MLAARKRRSITRGTGSVCYRSGVARRRRPTQRVAADNQIPMVYDGYYGGFVPVESASFDVSLDPEAIILLPESTLDTQRAAAESLGRREETRAARRARPRCDARNHVVKAVTPSTDGLLALCDDCSDHLDLSTMDSPALVDFLASRVNEHQQAKQRRTLERRLSARRHELEVAAGGIGHCPLCERFRRILQTRDGVHLACRACAGGAPIGELDARAAVRTLVDQRSPASRPVFLARVAHRFPSLV